MDRVMTWLKSKPFNQLFAVALASLLVFISTGCTSELSVKTSDDRANNVTEIIKAPSEAKDYPTVDTLTTTPSNSEEVIEKTEENLEKTVDTADELPETSLEEMPLNQVVEPAPEDVEESASNLIEDVVEETAETVENLPENVSNSIEEVTESEQASIEEIQEVTENMTEDVADDIQEVTDNMTEDVADDIQEVTDNVTEDVADDASDEA